MFHFLSDGTVYSPAGVWDRISVDVVNEFNQTKRRQIIIVPVQSSDGALDESLVVDISYSTQHLIAFETLEYIFRSLLVLAVSWIWCLTKAHQNERVLAVNQHISHQSISHVEAQGPQAMTLEHTRVFIRISCFLEIEPHSFSDQSRTSVLYYILEMLIDMSGIVTGELSYDREYFNW
jgi:hypothetical protein